MADKVFCDPVHRHIVFDKDSDSVLLDLIACPELQRLRRVHQLGVSSYTYPGAVHTRFSHALGAYHLMTLALAALQRNQSPKIRLPRAVIVAARCAALLHDLGHGPFSHLTERASSLKHEQLTQQLILEKTGINRVLGSYSRDLPKVVAGLLEGTQPRWQFVSDLLSSQLDVDRMDYLLRDAYNCGVSFGVYDYLRILHTMRIRTFRFDRRRHPVWLAKGRHAIEEFLYARYYMYWAVYYHKTTRGFEELYRAILRRAKHVSENRTLAKRVEVMPCVRSLLTGSLSLSAFLELDDSVMLAQIGLWQKGGDKILADLSARFLARDGFKPLGPEGEGSTLGKAEAVERAREYLRKRNLPHEYYLLYSRSVATAYDYYHPEKEEKTPKTSIMLEDKEGHCDEISEVLRGVDALRKEDRWEGFYYVPRQHEKRLTRILSPIL